MDEKQSNAQSRECPHCGNNIAETTKMCPHCMQWLGATPEKYQATHSNTCSDEAECVKMTVDSGPESEMVTNAQSEVSASPCNILASDVERMDGYPKAPGLPISQAAYSAPEPPAGNIIMPPAPPIPEPPGPEYIYAPQPIFNNAPFWPRVAATLIDGFIIAVPIGIVVAIVFGITGLSFDLESKETQLIQNAIGIFATLFRVLYYTLMEGTWGATLGKMALGMWVIRADGTPITYGVALGRIAVKELIGNCTCSLGYLSVAFNPEYRGWHDQLLGTRVIYTK